jgi:hypothetical protein
VTSDEYLLISSTQAPTKHQVGVRGGPGCGWVGGVGGGADEVFGGARWGSTPLT